MPLSGRKRKLERSCDYESKFCDADDVRQRNKSCDEQKSGEEGQVEGKDGGGKRMRALRKLKNFYASSSGQVALGKMKFKQGKLSMITPRYPTGGGGVGRKDSVSCASSSPGPPKLRKKRPRSQVGSSSSSSGREAEKENSGSAVSMFVISESKESEEDVGDVVDDALPGKSDGSTCSTCRLGGLGALGGGGGGGGGRGSNNNGSRTHREVVRQREEVPHTARLEAYCPPERKSKNILFTPR